MLFHVIQKLEDFVIGVKSTDSLIQTPIRVGAWAFSALLGLVYISRVKISQRQDVV